MANISIFIAFLAGILSFLSPCILPLLPAFLSYLTGLSVKEIRAGGARVRAYIFLNSLFYVLGFSFVFALAGVLLNSILSRIAFNANLWLGRVGGSVIILFGLYLLGIIKIPFFEAKHGLKVRKFRYSYLTSFVFGASFALGWTPCVGAILGAILTLAITQPGTAFYLLLSYSLGLGVPFLLAGIFASRFSDFLQKSSKFLKYFNIIGGIILIILGILVFNGMLSRFSNFGFTLKFL